MFAVEIKSPKPNKELKVVNVNVQSFTYIYSMNKMGNSSRKKVCSI